jgi:hypothetical protein
MRRPVLISAALAVALAAAAACSRPAPPQHEAAAPAPTPPPAPPPPAKKAVMICRSSVDGRSVKCGTPNAVMVGIKSE